MFVFFHHFFRGDNKFVFRLLFLFFFCDQKWLIFFCKIKKFSKKAIDSYLQFFFLLQRMQSGLSNCGLWTPFIARIEGGGPTAVTDRDRTVVEVENKSARIESIKNVCSFFVEKKMKATFAKWVNVFRNPRWYYWFIAFSVQRLVVAFLLCYCPKK